MLLTYSLHKAEKLINYYLQLDPETQNHFVSFAGSVLKIEITSISIHFYIKITEHGIELLRYHSGLADTIIRGTPLSLLTLLIQKSENTHRILQNQDITIIGNIALAQDLKNIFSEMEIDWEEYLSKICGDPLAHIIGTQFRNLTEWFQSTKNSLNRNVVEYIHEEAEIFPPRLACEDLYNDIDNLRDNVDRLVLRINRLDKKFSEHNA